MGLEHQSRSKRNEVARHMRREQTLQPQETCRIEESAVKLNSAATTRFFMTQRPLFLGWGRARLRETSNN